MPGQRQVFLHLRELGGQNDWDRVFLTIHDTLLQRAEHFWEGHWRGADTESAVTVHMHFVFHCAHLQALCILWLGDRAFAVRHVSKTVLRPDQRDQALGWEFGQQRLAFGAVKIFASMVIIAEQERDIHDLDFRHKVTNRSSRNVGEIQCAELNGFDHFTLAAQRTVRENLAFVTILRPLFNFIAERRGAHTVVRGGGWCVTNLHDGLCAG